MEHTLPGLYHLAHEEGKMKVRLEVVQIYRECKNLRETARRLSVSCNTAPLAGEAVRPKGELSFGTVPEGLTTPT